ncbi:type II toxin-antitoxin system RelE/ParE family toxin [Candidatus Uhrbacteria bacterium]|nr:type II toxin-antitoxin system RelE/ParE family toxin [Candidatus Uhrbacteria bacterium]
MIVGEIYYSRRFEKQFCTLPEHIQKRAIVAEDQFRENPLHSSLRLHQLKGELHGLWSLSINLTYRIILKRKDGGAILFVSIGKHDLYKAL